MNVVPILGRAPNAEAIAIVRSFLARLESGEVINVAIVGEQKFDGELFAQISVAPGNGEPCKLRGGIAILGAIIDKKILGGR